MTVRVACVQMRSSVDIAKNCQAMEKLVREAANAGAGYVQTPEMSGILQRNRKALFEAISIQDKDRLVSLSGNLAKELGIWLHIGSHAILVGEQKVANRAFLFGPNGQLVTTYDKLHMFDVDLDNGESWRESKVYQPGHSAKMVDMNGIKLGITICYDIRFPALYREYAQNGAQILSAPAAFTRQTGRAHWQILQRARAIENGAFMISAAQGGDHEDGRETYGHSMIVNPWGEILAELDHEEPGILVADIDLDEVTKAQQKIPNLVNARSFDLDIIS